MPDAPADDLSWADPPLRQRVAADPRGVLRDRGLSVPDDLPDDVVHEFVRVAHLLWVDGRVVPLSQFHIDPGDEGLLFGRGVWESTRTVAGYPWLWPLHLDRLKQTADLLRMPVDPARLPDADAVGRYVRMLTRQDVVVRLNLTAGRPGHPGLVWMSAAPVPVSPPSLRLKTWPNPVPKGLAYLSLKTFQYATRLRTGQQAAQAGYDTALLVDADGHLQEASHANLFVRLDDGWFTPAADGGFLPGTVRHHLLDRSPVPIRERVLPAAVVPHVREAFVTNSNIGVVPVTRIDDTDLPAGADTAALARWLIPPLPGVQYRFRETTPVAR